MYIMYVGGWVGGWVFTLTPVPHGVLTLGRPKSIYIYNVYIYIRGYNRHDPIPLHVFGHGTTQDVALPDAL